MKTFSTNDIADSVSLILRQNDKVTPSEDDLTTAIEQQALMLSVLGQTLYKEEKEKSQSYPICETGYQYGYRYYDC